MSETAKLDEFAIRVGTAQREHYKAKLAELRSEIQRIEGMYPELSAGAPAQQGVTKPKRMSRKEQRQARRREKRAILAQMPYRTAEEWADGMVTVRETMDGPVHSNEWQVVFCGHNLPADKDKAKVERHAANLKRTLRKKLRYYAAQEKRALCAVFGQRQKEGRDIFKPELAAPAPPVSEGLKEAEQILKPQFVTEEYFRQRIITLDMELRFLRESFPQFSSVTAANEIGAPQDPNMKAGPRCPKCGSGEIKFCKANAEIYFVGCFACNEKFPIFPWKAGLRDFAQFFPLPSPEQGWVKEAARLAFSRGGPIADWYCWCEICCLLRRVLPAPPRPSTEEAGK